MTFGGWLTQQFLDWQQKEGSRKTLTEFSDYLDVRQEYVSRWMNGVSQPGKKYIPVLAKKLGDDVYVMLGMPVPDPFRNVPEELSAPLQAAFRELDRIITEKQIDVESKEAKQIAREVFSRHGFTVDSIE